MAVADISAWALGGATSTSGSITSGFISSGAVGNFHISSGAITSGRIGAAGTPTGSLFLRDDFNWASPGAGSLASGSVQSGNVASGAIQGFFGATLHIASGTIGSTDLGSGAVITGTVGSGAVQSGNVASGSIGRFHIASGRLAGFELGSGSIVSGRIASGQIGNFHVASGQIQGIGGPGVPNVASGSFTGFELGSGSIQGFFNFGVNLSHIASGSLGKWDFGASAIRSGHFGSGSITGRAIGGDTSIASGAIGQYDIGSGINYQNVSPIYSGGLWTAITAETVSGTVAVSFTQSGTVQVAMASVSGRMPAVGVVWENALSGIQVNVHVIGFLQHTSGLADYSGYLGKRVWVGRSGNLTTISGSWSSGGFASGDLGQPIGMIFNSGGILVNVHPVEWSGGPLGLAAGGTF